MSSPPRPPPLLSGGRRPPSIGSRTRSHNASTGSSSSAATSSVARTTATSATHTSAADHSYLPASNLLLAGLDISTLLSSTKNSNDKDTSFVSDYSATGTQTTLLVPPRPRRLWKVPDAKLPLFPSQLYPPPNPQTSCCLGDPPSVIAVRIAECLRRRSAAVEYDEETCTANVVTLDRCALTVHLWRYPSTASSAPVVLVECVRLRGPLATFHWTTRAILLSAASLDAGMDQRDWKHAAPGEFRRILDEEEEPTPTYHHHHHDTTSTATYNTTTAIIIESALERAVQLLRKDRIEAQQLGMESIVALTDHHCAGLEAALSVALVVLGVTPEPNSLLHELHKEWIFPLLVERRVPNEPVDQPTEAPRATQPIHDEPSTAAESSRDTPNSAVASSSFRATSSLQLLPIEDHHAGICRSLALIAVANSLSLLARHQPALLETILTVQAPHWTGPALLQALTDDLQGVNRPPTVVQGTRLAGVHEAVLAVRCLEHLGKYSHSGDRVSTHDSTTTSSQATATTTLTLLDTARTVGQSTHEILYQQASRVYEKLTEEQRSC